MGHKLPHNPTKIAKFKKYLNHCLKPDRHCQFLLALLESLGFLEQVQEVGSLTSIQLITVCTALHCAELKQVIRS